MNTWTNFYTNKLLSMSGIIFLIVFTLVVSSTPVVFADSGEKIKSEWDYPDALDSLEANSEETQGDDALTEAEAEAEDEQTSVEAPDEEVSDVKEIPEEQPEEEVAEMADQPVVDEPVAKPSANTKIDFSSFESAVANKGPQTGTFELEGVENAMLYVPLEFNPSRLYPLILTMAGDRADVQKEIKDWVGFADRTSVIIACLGMESLRHLTDTPVNYDKWFFEVKKDIMTRYSIAKNKVFLIGKQEFAHYAAYLAVNNPKEFSAVALLDGPIEGPFNRIMYYQKNPKNQVPFYVALKGADTLAKQMIEAQAQKLQNRGYMVTLETLGDKEDFAAKEFQKKMYEWLNNKSDTWQDVIGESQQTWKEKVKTLVRDNIEIDAR